MLSEEGKETQKQHFCFRMLKENKQEPYTRPVRTVL